MNGLLLPLVAVFLLLAVNDRRVMGEAGVNGGWANVLLILVVVVTVLLGSTHVVKAATAAAGFEPPRGPALLSLAALLTLLGTIPVGRAFRTRRGHVD